MTVSHTYVALGTYHIALVVVGDYVYEDIIINEEAINEESLMDECEVTVTIL